jgi:hypothetical protein
MSFSGLRWTSRDGGAEDFAVAHGNPRPDPAPLIVVAVMLSRYDEDSWVDIHDTLGTILTLSERSRNDPAFQHESRDQAVIERALNAVPGREAWRPFEIEVDGTRRALNDRTLAGTGSQCTTWETSPLRPCPARWK